MTDPPDEKHMNSLARLLDGIWAGLSKTLFDLLVYLAANRTLATVLAILLFLGAGWLEYRSWSRADFYQRTVEGALSKRTENTPQTYKGIEALILSDAETDSDGDDIDFKHTVESAHFSPEFAATISALDKAFDATAPSDPPPQFEIVKSETTPSAPIRQQEAIITENNKIGFLFLPVRLLHVDPKVYSAASEYDDPKLVATRMVGIEDEKQNESTSGKSQQHCSADAPAACDDVIASRKLVATMKAATKVNVTTDKLDADLELQPAQVYYITENGINRIVSKDYSDDVSFYRNQFKAATVFPGRPYYVGAFNKITSVPKTLLADREAMVPLEQEELGKYFYVSEPYLDIGGNGIVITLARALAYPSHSDAVICFDLRLTGAHALGVKLKQLVLKLEGQVTPVTCHVHGSGMPTCDAEDKSAEKLTRAVDDLRLHVKNGADAGDLSKVIGAIDFIGSKHGDKKPFSWAATLEIPSTIVRQIQHSDDEVTFAVPLNPPNQTGTELTLNFMAAELNVGQYLQTTALMGFGGLILLVCGIIAIAVAWRRDVQKGVSLEEERRILHLALNNVSEVMLAANTPYARLDDTDHIINGNISLAAFLGYPATMEGVEKLKGTRFRDLIAEESISEYNKVQDSRKQGIKVDPYDVFLKVRGGKPVKAKVVSSYVPASQTRIGSLPETFGLLIPQQPVSLFRRRTDNAPDSESKAAAS
jgi:hypothetical protein